MIQTKEKPPHGAPCNGCGWCCLTDVCPIGVTLMGLHHSRGAPCPALRPMGDGGFACGVIEHPARYAPVRAAIVGEAHLRRTAAFLLGAGQGCDSYKAGDVRDEVGEIEMEIERILFADKYMLAFAAWGFTAEDFRR